MKRLIINADDLGLSSAVTKAVERCYAASCVTGVSLMALGADFQGASSMLRRIKKTEVGAHLTLTGNFSPCAKGKSLTGKNGIFLKDYASFAVRYFQGKIDPSDIYLELEAQMKKIKEAGLEITHLDSHEHIHVFPEVLRSTIRLAKEFGVPYIRLPFENISIIKKQFSVKDLLRYMALRIFIPEAKKNIRGMNICHNNAFWGHFHSGRMNDNILCFVIKNLKDGVNELALHPGVMAEELLNKSPWHKNAQVELDALLNGKWREILKSNQISLISHSEIS